MKEGLYVLGQNLRILRAAAGYTQNEISTMLHVSRQTYSNYENLSREPDLGIVIRMAEILQVSLDTLLLDTSLS